MMNPLCTLQLLSFIVLFVLSSQLHAHQPPLTGLTTATTKKINQTPYTKTFMNLSTIIK